MTNWPAISFSREMLDCSVISGTTPLQTFTLKKLLSPDMVSILGSMFLDLYIVLINQIDYLLRDILSRTFMSVHLLSVNAVSHITIFKVLITSQSKMMIVAVRIDVVLYFSIFFKVLVINGGQILKIKCNYLI